MESNPFAGAMEKANALRELFEKLPVSVIRGFVSARGSSGGKVGKETMWDLNFELVAWRPSGGALCDTVLRVTKKVSDEELKRLRKELRAETIVAISARLCENSPFGDARAQLVEVLAPPRDAELEERLADYMKPVELNDPLLGKLVLNKSVHWFEGKAVWLECEVSVALQPDENNSIAVALRSAETLWRASTEWDEKARLFAGLEMLENKNENWLQEGELELSMEQFMGKMRLNSITLGPDGGIDFWFDDGDMFYGHSIMVCGTLVDGFTDASIAG